MHVYVCVCVYWFNIHHSLHYNISVFKSRKTRNSRGIGEIITFTQRESVTSELCHSIGLGIKASYTQSSGNLILCTGQARLDNTDSLLIYGIQMG